MSDLAALPPVTLDPARFAHVVALVPEGSRAALLEQLSADLRQAAGQIAAAWCASPVDLDALCRACHALRGLAGTIGAEAVLSAATALGKAARLGDLAAATSAHDRLTRMEATLLAEVGVARRRAATRG